MNPIIIINLIFIGKFAFSACSKLSDLTLTPGLQLIGFKGFSESKLPSVAIPSSITAIGDNNYIYIYNNFIGNEAFALISSLTCVVWAGAVITTPTDIFLQSPNVAKCLATTATSSKPATSTTFRPSSASSLFNYTHVKLLTALVIIVSVVYF
jgi:hypothetical protein